MDPMSQISNEVSILPMTMKAQKSIPLNILQVVAKVSSMVHLVFEQLEEIVSWRLTPQDIR
jgi:hypothetical protein